MTHSVNNYGMASPIVKYYTQAPNLDVGDQKLAFDVSADVLPTLYNSPYFSPLFVEGATEGELGTFSVLHPSKRKKYIDNFFFVSGQTNTALDAWKKTAASPLPAYITWTPVAKPPATESFLNEYLKEYPDYVYKYEDQKLESYVGAVYDDDKYPMPIGQNDEMAIRSFIKTVKTVTGSNASIDPPTWTDEDKKLIDVNAVCQRRPTSGLWWALESNDFITEQMPFWINIKRKMSPKSSKMLPTIIAISFGFSDAANRYDLLLNEDAKPVLYDYTTTAGDYKMREWDLELAKIIKEKEDIEIGVMTAGGRLIVIINQVPLIYTRVYEEKGAKGGTIKECKIPAGKLKVYGTNISALVNACPMTFAPLGLFALQIPNVNSAIAGGGAVTWGGVDWKGDKANSVAHLPTPPSVPDQLYGVDCEDFSGEGGAATPTGAGFHKHGKIVFKDSKQTNWVLFEGVGFYAVAMFPSDLNMKSADGTLVATKNGATPYYFRLKGVTDEPAPAAGAGGIDISDSVLSITESSSTADAHTIKKSASITFYNPSNSIYNLLKDKQKAISLTWGWKDGSPTSAMASLPSFTGLITSMSFSNTPGMETLTINCEDYMHVLSNTKIINSPFYDGMVAVYAIMDLAKRAGCVSPTKDWGGVTENDYFLPSGYSYTKPAIKFESKQSILECITSISKRFMGICYFDGEGKFHTKKRGEGLFWDDGSAVAKFVQDPKSTSDIVILGEKNATLDYSSTVSLISIVTLERDTRNYILHTSSASPSMILYRRPLFIDQPAYGEIEVARKYAKELGKRVYFPTKKIGLKYVGGDKDIAVFSFIEVQGQKFRVISTKKSFNAESNDYTEELEAEWQKG